MPGEPVTEPADVDELDFEETLKKANFFTLRGCKEQGDFRLPKTFANFIYNISAYCTDPADENYKNPKAMFEALDLIYKIFDEIETNPQTNECSCNNNNKTEGKHNDLS